MMTITELQAKKKSAEKIACLTAYDATFAGVLDDAGVDLILVGDSLGMVIQGLDSTIAVTMDDMVYHTRTVAAGQKRALLMADMPFMSYATIDDALHNAARLMQEGGAQMVKLEGTANQAEVVRALAAHGIPVCAHLGLRPQFVHKLGGYKVQGRDEQSAQALLNDAALLTQAGADMLLLECIATSLAAAITHQVTVPVIGIGAGIHCDGQVLVLQDVLGITRGKRPRFSKDFMVNSASISAAVEAYVNAVRQGSFPGPEHSFK